MVHVDTRGRGYVCAGTRIGRWGLSVLSAQFCSKLPVLKTKSIFKKNNCENIKIFNAFDSAGGGFVN